MVRRSYSVRTFSCIKNEIKGWHLWIIELWVFALKIYSKILKSFNAWVNFWLLINLNYLKFTALIISLIVFKA